MLNAVPSSSNTVNSEYFNAPTTPNLNPDLADEHTIFKTICCCEISDYSMHSREQQSISIKQVRERSLTTSIEDQENNYIEIFENNEDNFICVRSEGISDTNCQHSSCVTLSSGNFDCNKIPFEKNCILSPQNNNEIYINSTYECIGENFTFSKNDGSTFCLDITDEELTSTYSNVEEYPAVKQREISYLTVSSGNFIKPVCAGICLGTGSGINRLVINSIKFANCTLEIILYKQ